MAFQWIVDSCESLSINRLNQSASTTARDGIVRTTSRGVMPKVFTVKFPDGVRWEDLITDIAGAETDGKYTERSITIPFAKFPWYYGGVDPITDDTYTVKCTSFPQWTIFARNQVSWSGPFVFTEVL